MGTASPGQSANSTACAMTSQSVLAPLLELAQDKDVRQLLEVGRQLFTNSNITLWEAGRTFFSNSNITVNLLPALAALIGLILLLLFILPLFSEDSHSSGYGAPSTGYDSPSSGYGAPASSYDAPSDSYGTRQYRSDDVGDYRSLVSSLKLSDGAVRSGEELSKAVADLVQPVVSRIGEAAGQLVQ